MKNFNANFKQVYQEQILGFEPFFENYFNNDFNFFLLRIFQTF